MSQKEFNDQVAKRLRDLAEMLDQDQANARVLNLDYEFRDVPGEFMTTREPTGGITITLTLD